MEKLVEELRAQIARMDLKAKRKYNLNKQFLDKLYSVYPFNKFEYVITHLIGTNTINLDQYLKIRNG